MTPRISLLEWKAILMLLVMGAILGARPAEAGEVSGVVLEEGSLLPICGAIVSLQASKARTTTDGDGTFHLMLADGADLVIVAAAKGYFNQSVLATPPAKGLQIILPPVPQEDDPSYRFMPPEHCSLCHPNQYDEWVASTKSNSGLNTWVHDIYSGTGTPGGMGGFVYTRDSVFANTNPNSECASCHQPEVWIANPFSRLQGTQDIDYPFEPEMHGISCETCHKVADVDVSKVNYPGIFPGAVTFTRPSAENQVEYGVLGDTDLTEPRLMQPSYQPQLVAEVCATCHQDKNDLHGNHTYTGVISEPTYIEWADSAYSDLESPFYANCVDCHMPPAGVGYVSDFLIPPLIRYPGTVRSHRIEGTTPWFLENAVELSMKTQLTGRTLEVETSIVNSLTGHHVPTGVTVRNMILLVEAWRAGEDPLLNPLHFTGTQTVHDLGGIGDPAQGYYAGLPGKFFAKVNHDATGAGPTFYTEATGITFDNRIAALDTDVSHYLFEVPPGEGTLHVRARLIYRRSFRFLTDAKQWTEDGHGNPLEDIAAPHFGHLMEMAEATLGFSVPCPPVGDGDVDGDGSVDGDDIAHFLDTLLNAPSGPVSLAFCAADLNGDAVVTRVDVDLFVGVLLGR